MRIEGSGRGRGGGAGAQIEDSGRGRGSRRVILGGNGRDLFGGPLGSRGCNAFRFFVDFADFATLARHEAQVLSSLLVGLDGSLRKQESRRFRAQFEQHLEDMADWRKGC
jgi:hypothetical protein